jgi:hypothetical protein
MEHRCGTPPVSDQRSRSESRCRTARKEVQPARAPGPIKEWSGYPLWSGGPNARQAGPEHLHKINNLLSDKAARRPYNRLKDMGSSGTSVGPLADNDDQLKAVLVLYDQVAEILRRFSTRRRLYGLSVLVLSVLTSGALWLLVGQIVPKTILWLGALASTATTAITLYIYSSGMIQTIAISLTLYRSIGKFVAQLRSEPVSQADYWDKLKGFEFQLERLRTGQIQDI